MSADSFTMDQKGEKNSAGRYVLPTLVSVLPDTVKEILKGAVVIAVRVVRVVPVL